MENELENDPVTNFDHLWKTLDKKYSFFTYKGVNWDSVYQVYRPQVGPETGQQELFEVMAEMLFTLQDGHVNLVSPFNRSRYWEWYTAYPANFSLQLIQDEYLGQNYEITGPLLNRSIDSVGYVYYGSFASRISEAQIDYIVQKYWNAKGIILDIRGNGGGSTANAKLLLSRFADQKRLTLLEFYKSGPGHDDFYSPVSIYADPAGELQYTKPVVVITNRRCFSAANSFVQQMKTFPHVTIVGDTTGGGGGTPIYNELPNGWRFRFSATQTTTPDGFNIEHGVYPDIPQNLDLNQAEQGIDSMIERALEVFGE